MPCPVSLGAGLISAKGMFHVELVDWGEEDVSRGTSSQPSTVFHVERPGS